MSREIWESVASLLRLTEMANSHYHCRCGSGMTFEGKLGPIVVYQSIEDVEDHNTVLYFHLQLQPIVKIILFALLDMQQPITSKDTLSFTNQ